jgi:hypothetical protein
VKDNFPYSGNENKNFPTSSTFVSSKYGTINVNAENRNETFLLDEFVIKYNSFRIYDDPLEIQPARRTSFLNMGYNRDMLNNVADGYNFTASNTEPEDFIRMYLLGFDNDGTAYEQINNTSVKAELGILFGISGLGIASIIALLNSLLTNPFRDLDLIVSFRNLQIGEDTGKNKVFSNKARQTTSMFNERLSCYFYFRWWLYYIFPCCFSSICCTCCCCSLESKLTAGDSQEDSDPTFGEAIEYYDRLSNNYLYHMSLKRESLEHLRWIENEYRATTHEK